ncbi:phosphotransferase enzyme family protein [Peribacillus sp. SCS-26]|uniref:phosphotransferase enzyme family protein n=1 Tax=Paraperibacillus marinus TaxID=3115295 RepID=UPI003905D14B
MKDSILARIVEEWTLPALPRKIAGGFQNQTYKSGTNSQSIYFRIKEGSEDTQRRLDSEMEYIRTLHEKGVPVSLPVHSRKERPFEVFSYNGNNYIAAAFQGVPGQPVNAGDAWSWNGHLFKKWGSTMGKMHRVAENLAPESFFRPQGVEVNHKVEAALGVTAPELKGKYQEYMERLRNISTHKENFGLIHNDFHQGNFHVSRGNIHLFDFDDCAFYWYANDIAASFYHAHWQNDSYGRDSQGFPAFFFEHFLEGYTEEKNLPPDFQEQIQLFLKGREFFLYSLFKKHWKLCEMEDWQRTKLKELEFSLSNDKPAFPCDLF